MIDNSQGGERPAKAICGLSQKECADFAQRTILLVDDQEGIRDFSKQVLRANLGCNVLSAQSGNEALDLLKAHSVDVVITDMLMPGLHGIELLTEIHTAWPDIDIIVMTGYPAEFPFVEVVNAGANDFLNKPFPHPELEAKIIRALRERKLRREYVMAERKYRILFELSADGMLLLDAQEYCVLDANAAFSKLCGRAPDELAGNPIWDILGANDRGRLEPWLGICARRGSGTLPDLSLAHSDGSLLHVDLSATFSADELEPIVFLTLRDVTEKREIETQLAEAAQKDPLTGLLNKGSFQNRIQWAVNNAHKKGTPLSLLMIDLDNFKACNDTHGHQVGDQLLIAVGRTIFASIRVGRTDDGFRCGGDEFTVLLQDSDQDAAYRVAQRMHEEFSKIERYGTTMSIGVAEYRDNTSAAELIRSADQALYKAKAMGKDTIQTA